jgi:NAD(P)-dependent dehydrogenase (short-subunit alcohol dehydrogenase family)
VDALLKAVAAELGLAVAGGDGGALGAVLEKVGVAATIAAAAAAAARVAHTGDLNNLVAWARAVRVCGQVLVWDTEFEEWATVVDADAMGQLLEQMEGSRESSRPRLQLQYLASTPPEGVPPG